MMMGAVIAILSIWSVFTALWAAVYLDGREAGKEITWSEIVFGLLSLPGLLLLAVATALLCAVRLAWAALDRPVREGDKENSP
jgi:hypothetical protein